MRSLAFLAVAAAAWLFTSCGPTRDPDVSYAPPPAAGADPKWDAVKALIAKNCGKCHNGQNQPAFDSAAKFKASAARAKLEKGLMPPPPAAISAADKAELLAYLGG